MENALMQQPSHMHYLGEALDNHQETETQSSVAEKTLHVMNIFSSSFFHRDKSKLLSHTVYQYGSLSNTC